MWAAKTPALVNASNDISMVMKPTLLLSDEFDFLTRTA